MQHKFTNITGQDKYMNIPRYVYEFTGQGVCFSPSRLVPGARYYYVFGDTYGWSEEHSFRATPKPGASVTSKIIAYGGRERGESEREVDY